MSDEEINTITDYLKLEYAKSGDYVVGKVLAIIEQLKKQISDTFELVNSLDSFGSDSDINEGIRQQILSTLGGDDYERRTSKRI